MEIKMNIINLKNGDLKINDKITISQEKDYYDILNLVPTNRTWDIKNGYKWIYFNNIVIDKLMFDIGVCFHNEKLFSIDFGFTSEQQKNLTWKNWNKENELKRKDLYEDWLTERFGEKRNYDWGKIGAYYDPRGCTTSISIKYKKRMHNKIYKQ